MQSGNITVKDSEISFKEFILYPLKTAFKIHLISARMKSEEVTALSKVNCLDFRGKAEEDSLSVFDETLGETFFGEGFKKFCLLMREYLCFTSLAFQSRKLDQQLTKTN